MPLTRSLCGKQTRRQVLLPGPPTKLPLATVIHTPNNSTLRKSDTLEDHNNHKFNIGYGQAISGSEAFGFQQEKHLGRAVSRILSARVAPRRGSFIYCDLTRSPDRFRSRDGPSQGPLFGLAPNGVYRAASLTLGAVGSYPTFSPLPRPKPWRFIFCGTFRQPTLASELPECIPGGTGVTRHRVLRCSDFPLPINWKRSSALPRCEKDKG